MAFLISKAFRTKIDNANMESLRKLWINRNKTIVANSDQYGLRFLNDHIINVMRERHYIEDRVRSLRFLREDTTVELKHFSA